MENLPTWVTWVFSGIGCVALTTICTLICKKKSDKNGNTKIIKKSIIKGNGNTSIQGSDDSSINIGK